MDRVNRVSPSAFEWICEIEPPTRPDLMHVRHQIGVLSKVASAYLVPDNHVGRATVSSVAVANEVDRMGGRSIACLNARDRNALGFRRDLLTGAAYGVDEFLFVQVSFDLEALLAWRDTVRFDGEVYAGVMVLPSASMARKLVADIPEITVPAAWLDAVERDRAAGVDLACELAQAIGESGAFDGVHLIPGIRYRETASRLEELGRR